jgi:hypothetical protein
MVVVHGLSLRHPFETVYFALYERGPVWHEFATDLIVSIDLDRIELRQRASGMNLSAQGRAANGRISVIFFDGVIITATASLIRCLIPAPTGPPLVTDLELKKGNMAGFAGKPVIGIGVLTRQAYPRLERLHDADRIVLPRTVGTAYFKIDE